MANGDLAATQTEMDAGVSDPTSIAAGQEIQDVVAEGPEKSLLDLSFVPLVDLQHANTAID